MVNVLIIENDLQKLGRVQQVIEQAGVDPARIARALTSAEANARLQERAYDLVILDINLPRRLGEPDARGEGVEILRRIERDGRLRRPRYIVGLTAFEDVIAEFNESFAEKLWALVHYAANSDAWATQISDKVKYVTALRASDNFTDGQTHGVDVAILCALPDVEFSAVRRLPCDWQPLRVPHDETRYLSGTIDAGGRRVSAIAAAAVRMGMPASAVLASKMITTFRPRILAMSGICAGRSEKTGLGDVIIADPSWDWGSGKIDAVDNKPRFRPSPHQLDINVDLRAALEEIFDDVGQLAKIKRDCRGMKPSKELEVHIAPMASGAAVVANSDTFRDLLDKNRDLTGLEMEAYGVFVASMGMGKPRPVPLVMKAVCDFADEDKNGDFQEFAAETSARCLHHALMELFRSGQIDSI